jgi:hypothetical protein
VREVNVCDSYSTPFESLKSIKSTLAGEHGEERHTADQFVDAVLQAFALDVVATGLPRSLGVHAHLAPATRRRSTSRRLGWSWGDDSAEIGRPDRAARGCHTMNWDFRTDRMSRVWKRSVSTVDCREHINSRIGHGL